MMAIGCGGRVQVIRSQTKSPHPLIPGLHGHFHQRTVMHIYVADAQTNSYTDAQSTTRLTCVPGRSSKYHWSCTPRWRIYLRASARYHQRVSIPCTRVHLSTLCPQCLTNDKLVCSVRSFGRHTILGPSPGEGTKCQRGSPQIITSGTRLKGDNLR